jgi:aspartyl-tRNA(Asn)/glutamyl-tRNA(Gln) amidotransferase subunit C
VAARAGPRGALIGAGLLAVSLVFRTIDQAVCDVPARTHWVWHLLNGVMLGWMIRVLHRHDPGRAAEAGPCAAGSRGLKARGRGHRRRRPMAIDRETARRVAHLARIEVAEGDLDGVARELTAILAFMDQLRGRRRGRRADDLGDADEAPWREDVVTDGGIGGTTSSNAPETRDGFFAVPKVVE